MKKEKVKKQRASTYESKLKIEGTFDNVMKAIVRDCDLPKEDKE